MLNRRTKSWHANTPMAGALQCGWCFRVPLVDKAHRKSGMWGGDSAPSHAATYRTEPTHSLISTPGSYPKAQNRGS
jgi:hypothetical protein